MARGLQWAVLAVVVGAAAPALACSHPGHGALSLHVGGFFLGVGVNTAPCPPPVVIAPPVVQYVAPAPVVVAPPPVITAPAVTAPRDDRPAALGLKYVGGGAALLDWSSDPPLTGLGLAHSVGLEGRLTTWLGLRSDLELRRDSRSWDVIGVKLWLPTSTFKPYVSASLAVTEAAAQPGRLHWGLVGAAGLDLWLGKHFFLEAELRYRVSPGDCCRAAPHVTGLVGAGVAFF
jgi:hypothetical protein